MEQQRNLQPELRRQGEEAVRALPPEEREALLVKCWMSHDARWFMAVAQAYGLEAASRLNRIAAKEEGKVEARRVVLALGRPTPATIDEYAEVQETLAALLTRDLVEYELVQTADDALQFRVGRCFAYENVSRAGVVDQYDCGIFARVAGWWEAFGLEHEIEPPLGRCLKAQGRECAYTFRLRGPAQTA